MVMKLNKTKFNRNRKTRKQRSNVTPAVHRNRIFVLSDLFSLCLCLPILLSSMRSSAGLLNVMFCFGGVTLVTDTVDISLLLTSRQLRSGLSFQELSKKHFLQCIYCFYHNYSFHTQYSKILPPQEEVEKNIAISISLRCCDCVVLCSDSYFVS